jgi:hypothetical protein
MDLFLMGVFDDERTAREMAPKVPVRCLEDELLPRIVHTRPMCAKCHTSEARTGKQTCSTCVRNHRSMSREKQDRKRYARRKTEERMVRDGHYVVTWHCRGVADDLVADGRAKWAGPRDLRRLGLRDDAVVILPRERMG